MTVSLEETEESFEWLTGVSGLPEGFESELRILHPLWQDVSATDTGLSWSEWEQASDMDPLGGMREPYRTILESTKTIEGNPEPDARLQRIRWVDVATRAGLESQSFVNQPAAWRGFARQGVPRWLIGSSWEGWLDPTTLVALFGHIADLSSSTPRCFAHFFAGVEGDWQLPSVVGGTIRELVDFVLARDREASPDYWWPVDKSWCVHTEYDSTVTDVGGPAALQQAIESDDWFETIPIPDQNPSVG